MYQITYKKKNGEVFYRIRDSLPTQTIGEETSMGWLILDVKYLFNSKYYSFIEYKKLLNKRRKYNHIIRQTNQFMKQYATTLFLIILIPLYLFK